jgi:hypothetical protein
MSNVRAQRTSPLSYGNSRNLANTLPEPHAAVSITAHVWRRVLQTFSRVTGSVYRSTVRGLHGSVVANRSRRLCRADSVAHGADAAAVSVVIARANVSSIARRANIGAAFRAVCVRARFSSAGSFAIRALTRRSSGTRRHRALNRRANSGIIFLSRALLGAPLS